MKRHKISTGATLVEAAIALPLIIFGIFIIVDTVLYFSRAIAFNYAAQRAATLAGQLTWDDDIVQKKDRVTKEALKYAQLLSFGQSVPTVPGPPCPANRTFPLVNVGNGIIEVELCSAYSPITPFLPLFTSSRDNLLTLRSKAVIFPPDEGASDQKANYCLGDAVNCNCNDDTAPDCGCQSPFEEKPDGSCGCPDCQKGETPVPETTTCACEKWDCPPPYDSAGYCTDKFNNDGNEDTDSTYAFRYRDTSAKYCECTCNTWNLARDCNPHRTGVSGIDFVSSVKGNPGQPNFVVTACKCLRGWRPGDEEACDLSVQICKNVVSTFDETNCACVKICPGNQKPVNGVCSCPNSCISPLVLDGTVNCGCVCPANYVAVENTCCPPCAGGKRPDLTNGKCDCPGTGEHNPYP